MSHKIVTNLMQFIWMQIAKYFTLSNTNLFVFFFFWSIAPSSCPNSELTIHWLARLWAFPPYWQSPLCKSPFFFFWRPTLPKRLVYKLAFTVTKLKWYYWILTIPNKGWMKIQYNSSLIPYSPQMSKAHGNTCLLDWQLSGT